MENNDTTNQKQDGIEERAKAFEAKYIWKPSSHCQSETEYQEFWESQIPELMASFATAETATITAENNRLRDALRGIVDVLESQPSYESFHEYELSGTPDLCRRCGKYIDHAYHGNALERAKALLDTADRANDADR